MKYSIGDRVWTFADDGVLAKRWRGGDHMKENFYEAKGLTPEEAVANLILKLKS